MGFLDDTASLISVRSSHSKRSKKSRSHRHKDRSRSRSRSRSGSRHHSHSHRDSHSHGHSHEGGGGVAETISGYAASIFGGGGGGDDDDDNGYGHHHRSSSRHSKHSKHGSSKDKGFFSNNNASRSSFFSGFGAGGASRSPSYYKRSPRPNFVSRVLRRLKRLLRDLVYYAKRHPLKVFMLVIMPLVTGGALTALLARFGLRLPPSLTRMLGLASKAATGDGIGLVGEAVRMASVAGVGAGITKTSIERGRDGGMQWERRSVEKDSFGGGGGWGDGLMGIAKMFS
ncbi:hypothetical protein B0T25DRAFT_1698 [Lasiosphaeria hispida]|uniref:Uncharacterized protein n=1 Tax=Lasiosphaeria hispida TaxID=260671 RepID=A0AAJ0MJ09_9PEZI|nr:hypothetical protein B0T25DRAFT_1698 [Lasiosphaeria hispida]